MKNFKRISTITLTLIISAAALMTACSGKQYASDELIREDDSTVKNAVSPSYGLSADGVNYESYEAEGAYNIEYGETYSDNSGSSVNVNDDLSNDYGQKIIRNADMSVETEEFDLLDSDIKDAVSRLGGYFQSSSVTGTGKNYDYRYGNYVIRIPSDKLDRLIMELSGNCTIISSGETSTDVTLTYVDTQSHIDSLRVEQEAIMGLLEQADDIDTIIALQAHLTDLRYEIEYYESSLRTLANQVDYSTLTLRVTEVVQETAIEETRTQTYGERLAKSFSASISDLQDTAKNTLIALVAALPYLAIYAIIIVFVILIIKLVIRIIRKRISRRASSKNSENANLSETATVEKPDNN